MNQNTIRSRVRRVAEVVHSGYSASYTHFLPHGERDQWGFGGRTICGATHRNGRWLGSDSPEEIAETDGREICPRCIKNALLQGMLDV